MAFTEYDFECFEACIHGAVDRVRETDDPREQQAAIRGWYEMVRQLFGHSPARAEALVRTTMFNTRAEMADHPLHDMVTAAHRKIRSLTARGHGEWEPLPATEPGLHF